MSEELEKDKIKVRFCIPPLKTILILAEPWTFTLYEEYRNRKFYENLNIFDGNKSFHSSRSCDITLPEHTILSISRIYIRQGASDYDSVTFITKDVPKHKKLNKKRFWAKLKDVNRIVCYPIGENIEIKESFGLTEVKPVNEFKFLEIDQ